MTIIPNYVIISNSGYYCILCSSLLIKCAKPIHWLFDCTIMCKTSLLWQA